MPKNAATFADALSNIAINLFLTLIVKSLITQSHYAFILRSDTMNTSTCGRSRFKSVEADHPLFPKKYKFVGKQGILHCSTDYVIWVLSVIQTNLLIFIYFRYYITDS